MISRSGKGLLVLSVDLPAATNTAQIQALASPFQQFQVAATWACDQMNSQIARLTDVAGSELAIRGCSQWVGVGRTKFAHHLGQRVNEFRQAGFQATTLALTDCSLDQNLDLLVKHRISWIREESPSQPGKMRPQSVRFGVWKSHPNVVFPGLGRWSRTFAPLNLRHLLQRAARQSAALHVRVDGSRVVGPRRESQLLSLVQLVAQHRSQGQLEIATLSDLADQLRPNRSVVPMQSILRRAA